MNLTSSENAANIGTNNTPAVYETENIPPEEKIIYERFQIKKIGFVWLIAELNPEENLAFGYANLDNDELAEWGYVSISELLSNGAVLDKDWKPCKFSQAQKIVAEEKKEVSAER